MQPKIVGLLVMVETVVNAWKFFSQKKTQHFLPKTCKVRLNLRAIKGRFTLCVQNFKSFALVRRGCLNYTKRRLRAEQLNSVF